ncbi:MAG TPA: amidohydrolase family protein [Vicinamibacterales bacterium]|jgi:5-methylthioadenosine/S-adenosylhomocysteine deaminase
MLRSLCAVLTAALWTLAPQPARRDVSLIITGGAVVTVDAADRLITPGAVAIDGRDIVGVDTADAIAQRFTARETIDARGQVVLPGLINTHTHAPMVLYRGLADDLALMEWLQKYIFPAEAKTVSPEFVRAGTRLAALEMIQSGTTAYADMYYFEEEIAKATKEAGIRGVLGQTIIQFPVPDAKTPEDGIARATSFIREWKSDELIVPAIAPHSMYTLDAKTLKTIRAVADKERAPVIVHLAETSDEVKVAREKYKTTPTQFLESIGFWGERTLAAHGVHLTPADIAILAKRRVGVSHNPESNMKLASGTAPVIRLQRAGVHVGLGTDGAASNNDLDMFEAMRQAAFLHKLITNDPRALPAKTAIRMATIEGARILGLEREIGSLESGKRADLLVVAMRTARQTPMYDPLSHLVYVTRGDDVQTMVVNGKIVMRDRRVLTLNEKAVLDEAAVWADKVRQAVR